MLTWPFVKIKSVIKNIRLQEICDVDSLFNDDVQVLQEKVMGNEVVLIPAEIGDDSFTSSVLVKVYRSVQCVSVAVFAFFNFTFIYFVFVEDWVLTLE